MRLRNLLENLEYEVICGNVDVKINKIAYNTKKVSEGNVFVCMRGYEFDSHKSVREIVSLGAVAVVVENTSNISTEMCRRLTVIKVGSTRKALAIMSANFFCSPQKKLTIVGITGTSGKTTTAYMVKELLENLGVKTGIIGTIEAYDGKNTYQTVNTTPESYEILHYMNEMINNGCRCVVMEVSSQALKLDRVYGITFDYGVFTNISPDHIGGREHESFEEYISCKMKLVDMCRQIIVNKDDEILKAITMQPARRITTVSVKDVANYRACDIRYIRNKEKLGMSYTLCKHNVNLQMSGIFNVYNSLMALAVVNEMLCNSVCAFSKMTGIISGIKVKGRLQYVKNKCGKGIIVDYAHNGYSMEKLLTEIKKYEHGRLIVIFGCGGNRARSRRYEMGRVAAKYADISIITTDNPRWEEPQAIIRDIERGYEREGNKRAIKIVVPDRREAIKKALSIAGDNDLILLIGKGHENYQEIKGIKYPLNEAELISSC